MIRNKFQFETIANVIQIDRESLDASMRTLVRGEVIVREKIDWNTDQMNKFFHGPVRKFLRQQFKEKGTIKSMDEVKTWAKEEFLGKVEENGFSFLRSSSSLGRSEYIEFLKDIDAWCQEWFGCGIPEPEQID